MDQLRDAISASSGTGNEAVYLKLYKDSLNTFPAYLLDGLDVIHLIAQECNLTNVDSKAFYGLSERLESIDFSHNWLTEVSEKKLIKMSKSI